MFDFYAVLCYCFPMKDLLFEIKRIESSDLPRALENIDLQQERQRRIAAKKRKESIAASLLGDWTARELAAELTHKKPEALLVLDGKHGKPQLSGAEAEISIAHSGEYAAAAAAKRPVGIDLERMRPVLRTLALRVCSPEEQAWIHAVPDQYLIRFFRLWTMKEAYGKMLGIGIFAPRRFYARFVQGELIELYPDCLFLFPEAPEGYAVSICIAREGGDTK